jgi:hypothetical protein
LRSERTTVLVIDNSASMNAVEAEATRLEKARNHALARIGQMRMGDRSCVIATSPTPGVVCGFTDHQRTLKKKIRVLSPTDGPTPLAEALSLARHLLAGKGEGRIVLLTDAAGAADVNTDLSRRDRETLQILPFGSEAENVAITRFQTRRSLGDAMTYELLVEVSNFEKAPVETRLELELNGSPLDVLPLKLEPGEIHRRVLTNMATEGGVLRAEITHDDALECDNHALAVLPDCPQQEILYYGPEGFFLQNVLLSLPHVDIRTLEESPANLSDPQVLVCHREVPDPLPEGNVLLIDPRFSCERFKVGEVLSDPVVTEQQEHRSLMHQVKLEDVLLQGARQIDFAEESPEPEVFLSSFDHAPLYLCWESPRGKVLLLTADLERSELPLRTAFPIMIASAMNWFRGSQGEFTRAFSTADPVTVPLETQQEKLTLRAPTGKPRPILVEEDRVVLGQLAKCGLWKLEPSPQLSKTTSRQGKAPEELDRQMNIACNLVDRQESDLRAVPPSAEHESSRSIAGLLSRPIWFFVITLAIFFSLSEWFLYHRRWVE